MFLLFAVTENLRFKTAVLRCGIGVVYRYQYSEGTHCLHFQGRTFLCPDDRGSRFR